MSSRELGSTEPVMPPEWTHEPTFPTRTALFNSRRKEKLDKSLALERAHPSPYFDKHFNRTQILFHDCFSSSGAFDMSWKHATSSSQDHNDDVCNRHVPSHGGLPPKAGNSHTTRTDWLLHRHESNRLASLKFQPTDEMRTQGLPKAHELTQWWKQQHGFVDDVAPIINNSYRLALQKQKNGGRDGEWTPPLDPARTRALAKHEFAEMRQGQREITPKITQIALLMDETTLFGSDFDKLAQKNTRSGHGSGGSSSSSSTSSSFPSESVRKKRHAMAHGSHTTNSNNSSNSKGSGGSGGLSHEQDPFEMNLQLAFSPIKTMTSPSKSRRRAKELEEMFQQCTNQREQLERKKQELQAQSQEFASLTLLTGGVSSDGNGSPGLGTTGTNGGGLSGQNPRTMTTGSAIPDAVRCGGFQT